MALKLRRGGRSGEASRARGYPALENCRFLAAMCTAFTILPPWSLVCRKACARLWRWRNATAQFHLREGG
ncbi:hypothetical protein [Polaromonas naphthalenivorans]|uniref:hypothetical protein n=1 Tax=Polaromonas naphthalenivorans TaxID=216465 RepID=UPI0012EED0EE|nr:hypothetical protein [Polaromonas naphthalenivorans]